MPLQLDLGAATEYFTLVGLVFTAALIILVADWRITLYALIAQYALAALLLSQIVFPSVSLIRVLSGALAVTILYITLHRLTRQRLDVLIEIDGEPPAASIARLYRPEVFVVGFTFRLLSLTLVAVGIVGISSSMTLLGLTPYVLFSGLWLVTAGILVAILSRDVLRLGLGILMFTSGFCILESAVEGSLFLFGLLNVADLLLAVVIAHLASVTPPEAPGLARRRGEAP
ncbi:MAG: hypothetical protein M1570_02195 [Chloroflexi bacterium]|nr:hypothetical protein [Chloroflexota bacterium]